MGDIMIASDVTEVWGAGSNLLYGTVSEDKVITFPKNALLISLGQYFYFSNSSGKARIVLPGGKAEDYALELTAEEINAENKKAADSIRQEERVEIFIERGAANDDPNFFVSVNGYNCLLPRGKKSLVPRSIAKEILRSQKAQQKLDATIDALKDASARQ